MKGFCFLALTVCLLLVGCGVSVKVINEEDEEVAEKRTLPEQSIVPEGSTHFIEVTEEIQLLDNGCYTNEVFVEQEQACALIIGCSDIASCIQWGDEVIANLEKEYGSLVFEEPVAPGEEGITTLSTYDVDHEEEVIYPNVEVPTEEMDIHKDLWFSFSWLIPERYRQEINRFVVFESGNTLAYVSLHDPYGKYWTLGMNNKKVELASETLVTYMHEFAHYLSLNMDQVDYWQDGSKCNTLFLKDSGCFYEDAYVYNFYHQFWETPGRGELGDYFVSDYASYSPEEDFAESFAHFVLTQRPMGSNVMEHKLLFFYQYDELVQMRTEILSRTATWMVRRVVE